MIVRRTFIRTTALLCLIPGICASAQHVKPVQQTLSAAPIRIWGHGALGKDYIESLLLKWEAGFQKLHPDVKFDNQLHGTASAIGALYTNTGDIALMGREIWPVEVEAFTDVRGYPPLGIDVATGSLDIRNKDFALVVFVNHENPLAHLNLLQIARLFGAEQKPPATWGELGLTGLWATRPIHLFGFEIHRGFGYFLEQRVFNGSTKWNPALVELGDVKQADGSLLDAGQRIVDAIGSDTDAIGYSSLLYKNPNIRAVPIGPSGGPFLLATHRTIADHTYPLTRAITAYIDRPPGKPADARVEAFLRYVLSPQGQLAVTEDGGYTALPLTVAHAEAAKLTAATPSGTTSREARKTALASP